MSTSKTILLVDDDAGLCKLLQTTLTTPEIAIVAASSGEQALTLAQQLRPELIILDMHLTPAHPSGLEVCRALKSDPAMLADTEGSVPLDSVLGDLQALQGVRRYPVRVRCALLAWNLLQETLDRYAIKPYQRVPIIPAGLGKDAGLLGATLLARGLVKRET